MLLDKLLGKKILKGDAKLKQSKMTLAAMEACKAKRLLGALRALWRSSATNGQDGNITHLKSFLRTSPLQKKHGTPASLPAPPTPPSSDDERDEFPDGEGEDGHEDASPDGEGHDGEGEDGREDASPDGEGEDGHEDDSESDDGQEADREGDDGHEDASPDREVEGDDGHDHHSSHHDGKDGDADGLVGYSQNSSDGSTLNASTLALGSPTPPSPVPVDDESGSEMSEDQRDSQNPGAWMGRAMMAARHLEREEAEKAKRNDRLKYLVNSVKAGLRWQVSNAESLDGSQLEGYLTFCHEALEWYGEDVFGKLCDIDFFKRWCLEQKRDDAQDWAFFGGYSKYVLILVDGSNAESQQLQRYSFLLGRWK